MPLGTKYHVVRCTAQPITLPSTHAQFPPPQNAPTCKPCGCGSRQDITLRVGWLPHCHQMEVSMWRGLRRTRLDVSAPRLTVHSGHIPWSTKTPRVIIVVLWSSQTQDRSCGVLYRPYRLQLGPLHY